MHAFGAQEASVSAWFADEWARSLPEAAVGDDCERGAEPLVAPLARARYHHPASLDKEDSPDPTRSREVLDVHAVEAADAVDGVQARADPKLLERIRGGDQRRCADTAAALKTGETGTEGANTCRVRREPARRQLEVMAVPARPDEPRLGARTEDSGGFFDPLRRVSGGTTIESESPSAAIRRAAGVRKVEINCEGRPGRSGLCW